MLYIYVYVILCYIEQVQYLGRVYDI